MYNLVVNMARGETSLKILLIIVLLQCIESAKIVCPGKKHLQQDYTVSCAHEGHEPDIEDLQACLVKEIYMDNSAHTCSTSGSCVAINIKLATNDKEGAEDMIWSFSGCYKKQMRIKICAIDHESEYTTGTTMSSTSAASTAPTSTPTFSTSVSTTPGNTTTSDATTTPTTTGTVTTEPAATSTTCSSTMTPLPPLEGCYTTVITWEKNRCAVQKQMVRLVNEDATGFISAYVQVVGCCNTDGCQVAGRKEQSHTCRFGSGQNVVSVPCASDCFTILTNKNGREEIMHGCLSDFKHKYLEEYDDDDVESCSSDYRKGLCKDVKFGKQSEEACLRCCHEDNCNTWTSKLELLGKDSGGANSAHLIFPSLFGVIFLALSILVVF